MHQHMDQLHEEEAMGSNLSSSSANSTDLPHPKGKRTKRPRSGDAATSSTGTNSYATEEDEDMANCLVLLARGPSLCEDMFTSRRFAEAANVYECKTCSKCFPSFQALGGHRTSHKKPRLMTLPPELDDMKFRVNLLAKPFKGTRVYECSICGSEFMSGQALGGHMRRHRPAPEVGQEGKREKRVLSLDLNMPAQAEEEGGEFVGSGTMPVALTFAAGKRPALVDCPYLGENMAVV